MQILRDVQMLVSRQFIDQWLHVIDHAACTVHNLERHLTLLTCHQHTIATGIDEMGIADNQSLVHR